MSGPVTSPTGVPPIAVRATAVRDAVLAVPGVAGMSLGAAVRVSTQFPGGMVVGVRLGGTHPEDPVEVRIVVDAFPIGPVVDRVRAVVRAALAGMDVDRRVDVVVDDIDLPDGAGRAVGSARATDGGRR